ncbi:MAG: DUF1565 domain-containing protein [bacterium]
MKRCRIHTSMGALFLLLAAAPVLLANSVVPDTVYVSTNGDNILNNGTRLKPWRSLTTALRRISPDSLSPKVIKMAAGTYSAATTGESFPIVLKSFVTILGSGRQQTIINAAQTARVFSGASLRRVTILSLCLENGRAQGPIATAQQGAGLYVRKYFTLEIRDCTFRRHRADGDGGALFVSRGQRLSLRNCWFEDNESLNGGAVYHDSSTATAIIGNTAQNNRALNIGGGFYFHAVSPLMQRCRVRWNSAGESLEQGAGGMVFSHSQAVLGGKFELGNDIYDNRGGERGSQIFVLDNDSFVDARFNFFGAEPHSRITYPTDRLNLNNYRSVSIGIPFGKRDFYVAPNGSDDNNGTLNQPWRTLTHAFSQFFATELDSLTVHLQKGIYGPATTGEKLPVLLENGVTLRGKGAAETIFDGTGSNGQVMFSAQEIESASLSRLTLRRATQGVLLARDCSDLNFQDLIFEDNAGTRGAAATLVGCSNSLMRQSIFRRNASTGNGGALALLLDDTELIENQFLDNSARRGGAVLCDSSSTTSLEHNDFFGNRAELGGAMFVAQSSPRLVSNRILNNRATLGGGGGLALDGAATPEIGTRRSSGNDIYDNFAALAGSQVLRTDPGVIIDARYNYWGEAPNGRLIAPFSQFSTEFYRQVAKQIPSSATEIFVSPDGNDAASGEQPATPLRTIAQALKLCYGTAATPLRLVLLPGKYSPATNGEHLPLQVKSFMTFSGDSIAASEIEGTNSARLFEGRNVSHVQFNDLIFTSGGTTAEGGVMRCDTMSFSRWENCHFRNNQAAFGGALYFRGGGDNLILESSFENNQATQSGGALMIAAGTLEVRESSFMQNGARFRGGAIHVAGAAQLKLLSNRLKSNQAARGSGVFVLAGMAQIFRNTMFGNIAGQEGGGAIYLDAQASAIIGGSLDNSNDFYGNRSPGTGACLASAARAAAIDASFNFFGGEPDASLIEPVGAFDIAHARRTSVVIPLGQDTLYVSPAGNDDTPVITPATPLRTLQHATRLFYTMPGETMTLSLANGAYTATTGEIFPVRLASRVRLTGSHADSVTLEGAAATRLLEIAGAESIAVQNVTLRGGATLQNGEVNFATSPSGLSIRNARHIFVSGVNFRNLATALSGGGSAAGISGAGIDGLNVEDLQIRQCGFYDNVGAGAGVYLRMSTGSIRGSRFHGNRSQTEGSAIYLDDSPVSIIGSRIMNNLVDASDGLGGAIFCRGAAVPQIGGAPGLGNDIYGNTGGFTGQQLSRSDFSPLINARYNYFATAAVGEEQAAPLAGFDLSYVRTQPLEQNIPPVLQNLSPPNSQPLYSSKSDTITLGATFIDPEDDSLSYVWYINNFPVAYTRNYTFLSFYNNAGEYSIRVTVSDGVNSVNVVWQIIIGTTAVQSPSSTLPTAFKLEQSYPNPFRRRVEASKIVFHVPRLSQVSLTIYDVLGRSIRHLVNGQKAPGVHEVAWEGRDENGRLLPNGIYWLKMQSENFQATRQITLMK